MGRASDSAIWRDGRVVEPLPPRERILAAARNLFYSQGIKAVGVEAIASAAKTNKMTLYRHFESKDLLVAEYLLQLAKEGNDLWDEMARAHPNSPRRQLLAWLRFASDAVLKSGGRGCALANAAVELPNPDHPGRKVIEEYKSSQRSRLMTLCRKVGTYDAGLAADQIFLLLEGARVNLQTVGPGGPSSRLFTLLVRAVDRSFPRKTVKRKPA